MDRDDTRAEGRLQTSQRPAAAPGAATRIPRPQHSDRHVAAPQAAQRVQPAAPGVRVRSLAQRCGLSSWYLNDHPPADNPGGDQRLLIGAGFQLAQLGRELLQAEAGVTAPGVPLPQARRELTHVPGDFVHCALGPRQRGTNSWARGTGFTENTASCAVSPGIQSHQAPGPGPAVQPVLLTGQDSRSC